MFVCHGTVLPATDRVAEVNGLCNGRLQSHKGLSRDEVYGLATQLRRAAVAVPTNIADGQARFSPNEFFYFLGRARGALVEVETQLLIAQNLNYFSAEQGQQLLNKAADVGKILNGLIASIRPAA
jgi:four helix bundle protein